MPSLNSPLDIVNEAKKQGWRVEDTKSGIKLFPPDPNMPPVGTHLVKSGRLSSSNGDSYRGVKQFRRDMRRSGFDETWGRQNKKESKPMESVGLGSLAQLITAPEGPKIAPKPTNGSLPQFEKKEETNVPPPTKIKDNNGGNRYIDRLPPEVDGHALGKHIAKLRRDARVSQAVLAHNAGLKAGHIGSIESGSRPSMGALGKIAEAVGTTAEKILRDSGYAGPLWVKHVPGATDIGRGIPAESPVAPKPDTGTRIKQVLTVSNRVELKQEEVYQALFIYLGQENVKLPPLKELSMSCSNIVLSWTEEEA